MTLLKFRYVQCQTLEVFRNEVLAAWQKDLNVEMILIPEFVNSEMKITSTKICSK